MRRYSLFTEGICNSWIGENTEGKFVLVDDVIIALENICVTCDDRSYEDICELIGKLSE